MPSSPAFALAFLCTTVGTVACAAPQESDEAVAPVATLEPLVAGRRGDPAPRYRDVDESFTDETSQNRWFELKRQLRQAFDQVCGDTFCEGDFSNLEALSFRCSAAIATNQLRSCLWIFAGSYETVTPSTGTIHPTARTFLCKIPVQGTVAGLMDALLDGAGPDPLHRPLPAGTGSIYDVVGACL
jgi:hypothetical protein